MVNNMKKIIFLIMPFLFFSCTKSSYDTLVALNNPTGTKYFQINSHPSESSSMATAITVTGIASDSLGVSKIEVCASLSSGPVICSLASGITNWSYTQSLGQGVNTIYAKATLADNSTTQTDPIIVYKYWEKIASFTFETGAPAFSVNGNTAYIYSGAINGSPYISSQLYHFNMATNLISNPSSTVNKNYAGNAYYHSGQNKIIVFGGVNQIEVQATLTPWLPNDKIYFYNPDGSSPTTYVIPENYQRFRAGFACVANKCYIIGGIGCVKAQYVHMNTIIEFDVNTHAFTLMGVNALEAVASPQVFVYGGKIYIFGGDMADNKYSKKLSYYIPGEFNHQISNPIINHRTGGSVVVIGSKAYVLGGEQFSDQINEVNQVASDKIELLDLSDAPTTITSKSLKPMPVGMKELALRHMAAKYMFLAALTAPLSEQ